MKKLLLLINLWLFAILADAQCWKVVAATRSADAGSTLAIASDGTLWGFGYNGYGQLGDGTTINRPLPVQIGTDNDWVYVATSFRSSYGIKADGTLWSWGENNGYNLGDGTNVSRFAPEQVGTDTNWQTVNANLAVVVALKTDGTIWWWGADVFWNGAPNGAANAIVKKTPTQLGTDTDWISIERGISFTMALKADGSRWGYGSFLTGVAGNGTAESGSVNLVQLDAGPWKSISASAHALGIKLDGSLWSWGNNSGGQAGNGTISSSVNVPVLIDNSHTWKMVHTGYHNYSTSGISFAIRDDNTLWSWGGARPTGTVFTLGQGNTTPTNIPKQVGTNSNWLSVSAGGGHTAGIQGDNTLWTWGYAVFGQLGNGEIATNGEAVLSPFKVVCPAPLPVTLQSFAVERKESAVQVIWTTTSEVNTDQFEIQRSTDAKIWKTIGEKKAEGSKASRRDYALTDASPASGINYYRLKMIDLDNTFSYSRMQSLKIDVPFAVLYPNPVSDHVFITIAAPVQKIELINVNGQIVAEYASNPVTGINVKSLATGLSVIRITDKSGNIQQQKIVIKR